MTFNSTTNKEIIFKTVEDTGEHNCEAKTMFECIKFEED